MRKIIFCLAAFLLAISPCEKIHAAHVWKMGHTFPADTPEGQLIRDFADRVFELSAGEIKIRIFPAMQLGDWTVMQQRVAMGNLEMAAQPASSQAEKRLAFLYFPYLFKNLDMLQKNLADDSPFKNDLDQLFISQNIFPIAYIPLFFGGIGCNRLPENWNIPEAAKSLRLRVPNDPAFILHAQSMGYQPVIIPMADTFTAFQTGMVDGVLGFGANGNYAHYRDLVKFYIPINDFAQIWPVMINLQLWQKLSQNHREILQKAARELLERRYREFNAQNGEYIRKLKAKGVTIPEVEPEIINSFAKRAREKCWPELAEKIDSQWITRALQSIRQ